MRGGIAWFGDGDLIVARRHCDRHPRRHRRLRRSNEQSVLVVLASSVAAHLNPAARSDSPDARLSSRAAAADPAGVVDATTPGTTHPDQDAPELVSDQTVDEEIGGRVESEKSVGDGADAIAHDVLVQLNGRHEIPQRDGDAQCDVFQTTQTVTDSPTLPPTLSRSRASSA